MHHPPGPQLVTQPHFEDKVWLTVLIRGKEYPLPASYPKNLPRRLCNDKQAIEHWGNKLTGVLQDLCKANPKAAPSSPKDTKADPIYKRVFCDWL